MFTGLVEFAGVLKKTEVLDGEVKIHVSYPKIWNDLKIGESISVDGVCLTLESVKSDGLEFCVGKETLKITTFGKLNLGTYVNLERSLRMGDRLGGHFVLGHVDSMGEVLNLAPIDQSLEVLIGFPKTLSSWITKKGSICINGVSLTVNEVSHKKSEFSVFLIPETLRVTSLKELKVGDKINLEADYLAKIVSQNINNTRASHELS